VLLVVCNLTPVPREHYELGVPIAGFWREVVNSDARDYGGSGWGNLGGVASRAKPSHGRPFQVSLSLPPLSTLVFRHEEQHAQHAQDDDS
jgi:1,4-alpha-glucan branching enzyme